jgi:5-oxoprolinase (ATP-hydrolysing) subunit C
VELLAALQTDPNNVQVSWPAISRRRFGVPLGGPFDEVSFRVALCVVGPSEGSGLEIGFMGGTWSASADLVVGVCGAERKIEVDGNDCRLNRFHLNSGQVLKLGPARNGHRSYIVAKRNDPSVALADIRVASLPWNAAPLRVITANPDHPFFGLEHIVSPQINRIGLRLAAQGLLRHETELPSEPQCVGAIQITPDGTPIIIGPEGPTLGGYPKVGAIATTDLPAVAQLIPGDKIKFRPITLSEGVDLRRAAETELHRHLSELRIATRVK